MSMFKKATKEQSKLRLCLCGPSGSGKTFSALRIAGGLGKKIAFIDSERGSASKYVGEPEIPEFDVCNLESFAPRTYVAAIRAAELAGYDVIVIDSLTHAWAGVGGALEMVDDEVARQRIKNSFVAWRSVTPEHNMLVDAMLRSSCHIIATLRVKTAYEISDKKVEKIGLAPIQRDGLEYEFDVVGDIDLAHRFSISKTRCRALDRRIFNEPGDDLALELKNWLSDGVERVDPVAQLVGLLQACPSLEEHAKLVGTGRQLWRSMNAAQREQLMIERDRALVRLERSQLDAEEAAAAEAAFAAQEAAERAAAAAAQDQAAEKPSAELAQAAE